MASVKTAHAASSVRARSRPDPSAPDRKVVYKPVVDNPLTVDWPPLPATVRAAILDELLRVIEGATTPGDATSLADWRLDQHARRRGHTQKRPRSQSGLRTDDSESSTATRHNRPASARAGVTGTAAPPPPPLLSELVVGINEVTRALESRIRWGRWELGDAQAAPPSSLVRTPEDEPGAQSGTSQGRQRKRRRPTNPPSSARIPAPGPPVGDHPAYAFIRDPRTPSAPRPARPPTPTRDAPPPYLTYATESTSTSWRILVNSDARRLTKRAEARGQKGEKTKKRDPTLVPAHPSDDASAAEAQRSDADPLPLAPNPSVLTAMPVPPPTVPLVDLVFVCKPDINPPSLVAHLPTMVAAANGVQTALDSVLDPSSSSKVAGDDGARAMDVDPADGDEPEEHPSSKRPQMRPVLLVPLGVGAERKLADALGLRRVAAIAVSVSVLSPRTLCSFARVRTPADFLPPVITSGHACALLAPPVVQNPARLDAMARPVPLASSHDHPGGRRAQT